MKKITTLLVLFLATPLLAINVPLAWPPSPAFEGVTKYTLYQAPVSGGAFVAVAAITDNSNQYVVSNLSPGAYWFKITASNSFGEGPASKPLYVPAGVPGVPDITSFTLLPRSSMSVWHSYSDCNAVSASVVSCDRAEIVFTTEFGPTYQVQWREHLDLFWGGPTYWVNVTPCITGNGGEVKRVLPLRCGAQQGFFRVVQL